MELINKDTLQIKEFISSLDSMLIGIESIVKHYKPHLNGERFLSNNEVSKKLNVSLRTLQEWRDTGLIPFIQIKGKITEKADTESAVQIMLQHMMKHIESIFCRRQDCVSISVDCLGGCFQTFR